MHRNIARLMAPLALIAAMVAIVLVVSRSTGSSADDQTTSTQRTSTSRTTTQTTRTTRTSPSQGRRRSFTVRAGDNFSTVAEATGLSVDELAELNPDVDPNELRVGQRLKLAPGGE